MAQLQTNSLSHVCVCVCNIYYVYVSSACITSPFFFSFVYERGFFGAAALNVIAHSSRTVE